MAFTVACTALLVFFSALPLVRAARIITAAPSAGGVLVSLAAAVLLSHLARCARRFLRRHPLTGGFKGLNH